MVIPEVCGDYDLSSPWDSNTNRVYATKTPYMFRCHNESCDSCNSTSYFLIEELPNHFLEKLQVPMKIDYEDIILIECNFNSFSWNAPITLEQAIKNGISGYGDAADPEGIGLLIMGDNRFDIIRGKKKGVTINGVGSRRVKKLKRPRRTMIHGRILMK